MEEKLDFLLLQFYRFLVSNIYQNKLISETYPLDKICNLDVSKTSTGPPGNLLHALCMFNLHLMYRGSVVLHLFFLNMKSSWKVAFLNEKKVNNLKLI